MKKNILTIVALLLTVIVFAQKTPREEIHENLLLCASQYTAYVDPTANDKLTPAPKGYEPFYLSHYGRHGSRWLIEPWQYNEVMDVLERAHQSQALTTTGEQLYNEIKEWMPSTKKRLGELSNVGERQHHRIGKRLTEHFPEIFGAKNCDVDARSTVVIRCILSMEAECEELLAFNPRISIHNDVSESFQYYLNQPWSQRIKDDQKARWNAMTFDYKKEYRHPERMWNMLFKDPSYRDEKIKSRNQFINRLFNMAANMQSHGPVPGLAPDDPTLSWKHQSQPLNLFKYFTEEEIFDLWRVENLEWYMNYVSGTAPFTQANLLWNIIETCDTTLHKEDYYGATMRFGHEVCVLPLSALLELGDAGKQIPLSEMNTLYDRWANFRIFPMACNVQLIFYRPTSGRWASNYTEGDGSILVKALLNEREVTLPVKAVSGPYVRWKDLRQYYADKLTNYTNSAGSQEKK